MSRELLDALFSLACYAAAWGLVWAVCWWPLARVWPTRRHYFRDIRETTTAATPAPGQGQFGGRTFEAVGPLRFEDRGARVWAPHFATVLAFAIVGLADWLLR